MSLPNGWQNNIPDGTLDLYAKGTKIADFTASAISLEAATTITSTLAVSGVIYGKGTKTELTSNGAVTYTAAQMITGYIEDTSHTGAVTATTDTAANIIAAMGQATVGSYFDLIIVNDGNQTVTLAGGNSVTLHDAASTMATGLASVYRVLVSSSTTVLMFRLHDAA